MSAKSPSDEVEITPAHFRQALQKWRIRRYYTQSKAAGILGIPVDTYRTWEQGRHLPQGLAFQTIWKTINR